VLPRFEGGGCTIFINLRGFVMISTILVGYVQCKLGGPGFKKVRKILGNGEFVKNKYDF
jgi:hypothetical protein